MSLSRNEKWWHLATSQVLFCRNSRVWCLFRAECKASVRNVGTRGRAPARAPACDPCHFTALHVSDCSQTVSGEGWERRVHDTTGLTRLTRVCDACWLRGKPSGTSTACGCVKAGHISDSWLGARCPLGIRVPRAHCEVLTVLRPFLVLDKTVGCHFTHACTAASHMAAVR